jgi:integrase
MYNPKQKEWYMKDSNYEETTVELLEKIFNSTEFEENNVFEKDVCYFNQLEVTDLLKSLNSKSRLRLQNICVYLKKYYDWCYRKNIVQNIDNPFDRTITDIIIDDIIPKEDISDKYFNEETLLEYKDKVKDPMNKFILYAIYSSIKGDEYCDLVNLKMSDLDEKNKTVTTISGRIVEVNDLFIQLMKDADRQTHYYPNGEIPETNFDNNRYPDSPYVIKTCRATPDPVKYQIVANRLKVIKNQTENEFMSVNILYKNGLVNYIQKKFALKNITLKTALTQKINGRTYTYDTETEQYIKEFGSLITVRMLRREIVDYLNCYE